MKRPGAIALAALCLVGLLGATVAAAEAARPNVVFILADDLGYMDVGADNPQSFYETPNIDGLAARGMRFTQGYAACPVCSPTRASIMTGKYPPRTGITDFIGGNRQARLKPAPNQDHLALEEVTIAERFRDAGYATFFAGKWHLGDGDYSPNAQGFGPGLKGRFSYYPPSDVPPPKPRDDPKATDRIANEAIRFIAAHPDQPFFAYLSFQAVHVPIQAAPQLVEKYQQKSASAPADAWGSERAQQVRLVQNQPVYAAMLQQMDDAIGRVVEALERAGVAERTIIVFTSDNGGLSTAEGHPTSNLPLRGGKGWPYEGGIRTPWIIAAPGVTPPGSDCEAPVITTDLYPTLLELAGLPLAPAQHVDGVSLVAALKGGELSRAAPLFWHYPHYGNQGGAPCSAVRDGDWKLIEWFEDGSLELFNLRDDAGELHSLAAENPDKTQALHAKLVAWRADVQALMPTPSP
ncbi:MAG TPA: sulfatase [Pirellulales bacterium]|jgi:arylsulfatase A-like enzyme|nr:sulfatase [Pirellulales bacterium]